MTKYRKKELNYTKCDPADLFPLDDFYELEKLAVFGICVAGKSMGIVWPKVQELLNPKTWWTEKLEDTPILSPFEILSSSSEEEIKEMLHKVKMGQYERLAKALKTLGNLPTYGNWKWYDLLKVPGVSYKTAKLVQLYTYPGQKCACLDRHVLKAMKTWPLVKKMGIQVPSSAPQEEDVYSVLETVFLMKCKEERTEPWMLDKKLWLAAKKG